MAFVLPAVVIAVVAAIWLLQLRRVKEAVTEATERFRTQLELTLGETVYDHVTLLPVGTVGRQARAEQARGVASLVTEGLSGVDGAEVDPLPEPVVTYDVLALTTSGRLHLAPITQADATTWEPQPPRATWQPGTVTVTAAPGAVTRRVTIAAADGSWTQEYESGRDVLHASSRSLDRIIAALAPGGTGTGPLQ